MEAKHLEPEELEYELKLRKLRYSTNSISSSPLQVILEKERKGILKRPSGFPPINDVTIELLKCQEKVKSIQERVNIALADKNGNDLLCARSRLLHVIGRITLLGNADPKAMNTLRELNKIAQGELEIIEQELRNMSTASPKNHPSILPNMETAFTGDVEEEPLAVVVTFEEASASLPPPKSMPPVTTSQSVDTTATSQSRSHPLLAIGEADGNPYTKGGAIRKNNSTQANADGVPLFIPLTEAYSYGAHEQRDHLPGDEFLRGSSIGQERLTRRSLFALEASRPAGPSIARSTSSQQGPTEVGAAQLDSHPADYWGQFRLQDNGPRLSSHFASTREPLPDVPISQAPRNLQFPPPRQPALPQQSQPPSPSHQNYVPRRGFSNPVTNWQIRFDGAPRGLAVDDFLFRVETLARADGVPQSGLVYAVHQLLTGRAATWYWQFCRKYPRATWSQLCYSLRREFEDTSDFEIRKQMEGRRQRPREAFSDFRLEIEGLALRLREPIGQMELLALIRRNMHPALQKALILHDCNNVDEMDRLCRQVEKLWTEVGETAEDQMKIKRHNLHEIEYEPDRYWSSEGSGNTTEFQVASLHERNKTNQNFVICWKCDDIGHTYKDCPSTNPRIFCYSCGARNVVKPNCLRCAKGNRPAGQGARGHLNPQAVRFTPSRVLQKVHRATMTD